MHKSLHESILWIYVTRFAWKGLVCAPLQYTDFTITNKPYVCVYVWLPTAHQSAFPKAALWGVSDVHECSDCPYIMVKTRIMMPGLFSKPLKSTPIELPCITRELYRRWIMHSRDIQHLIFQIDILNICTRHLFTDLVT